LPVLDVVEVGALPAHEHGRWAHVGLHHEGGLLAHEVCGGGVGGGVGVGDGGGFLGGG
jgi:hypothetical protein